jgi:uncharacterized protein with von Willebrand factor type A (vWA) domain
MKVIKQDSYDQILFDQVVETSTKIADLSGPPQSDDILSDAFASFYKSSPEVDSESLNPAKALIENMMSMQEYKNTRAYTRFDDVASALALTKFGPELVKSLKKMEKMEQENPGSSQKSLDDSEEGAEIRSSIRSALKKAQQEAEEWSDAAASWGTQSTEFKRLPHEEKMKLAEKLMQTKSINDISKLLGRLKNMATASLAKTPVHGADEIVDTGIGSDIARMLPTEALKYSRLRTLFYKDMLEGGLQVYNLRGVDTLGYGPIIACLDVSGSMFGSRETWAKSVVLALAYLAEKQKRDFCLITFEAKVMSTKVFPKGVLSLKDKVDIAQIQSRGGGTSFIAALDESFKVRRELKAMKPADIVFITDGECHLSTKDLARIQSQKEELSIRVYAIGIDIESDKCLTGFADNISLVNDTGDITHAQGVLAFASMGK